MKTTLYSPQHFLTSQWSGGTTTQLYISPTSASLSEINFDLRISTAKVEANESAFTALPGVDRNLMILEGEITIAHEGEYSKQLKPFDVDCFSGDWKTTAVGTCTDFNVMTTGKLKSELYHLSMGAVSNYRLEPKPKCKNLFLYATSGSITLPILKNDYILRNGSLLVIENYDNSPLTINSEENFGLVVVEINNINLEFLLI